MNFGISSCSELRARRRIPGGGLGLLAATELAATLLDATLLDATVLAATELDATELAAKGLDTTVLAATVLAVTELDAAALFDAFGCPLRLTGGGCVGPGLDGGVA